MIKLTMTKNKTKSQASKQKIHEELTKLEKDVFELSQKVQSELGILQHEFEILQKETLTPLKVKVQGLNHKIQQTTPDKEAHKDLKEFTQAKSIHDKIIKKTETPQKTFNRFQEKLNNLNTKFQELSSFTIITDEDCALSNSLKMQIPAIEAAIVDGNQQISNFIDSLKNLESPLLELDKALQQRTLPLELQELADLSDKFTERLKLICEKTTSGTMKPEQNTAQKTFEHLYKAYQYQGNFLKCWGNLFQNDDAASPGASNQVQSISPPRTPS